MSGIELAMVIQPHAPEDTDHLITSSPDTPRAKRASLLQPAGIFTKPIDTQALLDLIDLFDLLRTGAAERPNGDGSCRI